MLASLKWGKSTESPLRSQGSDESPQSAEIWLTVSDFSHGLGDIGFCSMSDSVRREELRKGGFLDDLLHQHR